MVDNDIYLVNYMIKFTRNSCLTTMIPVIKIEAQPDTKIAQTIEILKFKINSLLKIKRHN